VVVVVALLVTNQDKVYHIQVVLEDLVVVVLVVLAIVEELREQLILGVVEEVLDILHQLMGEMVVQEL
jgi:exosortase/archaeosortase